MNYIPDENYNNFTTDGMEVGWDGCWVWRWWDAQGTNEYLVEDTSKNTEDEKLEERARVDDH